MRANSHIDQRIRTAQGPVTLHLVDGTQLTGTAKPHDDGEAATITVEGTRWTVRLDSVTAIGTSST